MNTTTKQAMRLFMKILSISTIVTNAQAETIRLNPSQDGDVYSFLDRPTSTIHTLNVSSSGQLMEHSTRTLIQFDLTSLMIPSQEIGTAILRLFTYQPDQGATQLGPVSVHRQGGVWTAPNLRWMHIQPMETINTISISALNQWVEIDVTNAVRQWVSGTHANFGFVLKPQSETQALNLTFLSNEVPNYQPQLVIQRAEAPPNVESTPTLHIQKNGSVVALSWPVTSLIWTLQTTESLTLANSWTALSIPPLLEDGKFVVRLDVGSKKSAFFRLVR